MSPVKVAVRAALKHGTITELSSLSCKNRRGLAVEHKEASPGCTLYKTLRLMSRCARRIDEEHCIDRAHGDSGTVQLGFHGSAEAIGLGDPALVRRTERSFAKPHPLGLEAFNFGRYRGTPCRDLRRRAECRGSIRKAREVMGGIGGGHR